MSERKNWTGGAQTEENHATEKDSSGGGCPSTETNPGRWRRKVACFSSKTESAHSGVLAGGKSGAVDSSTTKSGRRRGTQAHGRENLRTAARLRKKIETSTAARCGRKRAKPGRQNPSAIEEMKTRHSGGGGAVAGEKTQERQP
jgi:hypothetical protein